MIFKTFDNNVDKISAKWGIFGRSFNDIGTTIVGRITDINRAFQATDDLVGSIKDSNSIWKRFYPSEGSIKDKLIDINSLYPQRTDRQFSSLLSSLIGTEEKVKSGNESWQRYFNGLKESEKWQIKFVQNTDLQKASLSDVKKAYDSARASALAHNEALKAQTLSAKAGKTALHALAKIGNIAAIMLISKGIEAAFKGIDNLIHSAEHCKERVDELMSSYRNALDEANSNAKTAGDLAVRYETLSKGVNNLGQNLSLTTDEYAEYNNVVNQIADMFPQLVQGYTDEGNAILSLKGNVEQLRDAYKDAQQEAYNLIINGEDSSGNDIIQNWRNTQKTGFWSDFFDFGADDVGGGISMQDAVDQLKAVSEMSAETYRNIENTINSGTSEQIQDLPEIERQIVQGTYIGKALGIDSNIIHPITDEEFEEARKKAKALAQTYQAELDSALKSVRTLANAYLMTNEDYAQLDEDAKSAASIIINSLDAEIANGFDTQDDVGQYVVGIVDLIKDDPGVHDALIGLFTLDTTDMPITQAKTIIDQYINAIAGKLGKTPLELKAQIGFDDIDTLANNYEEIANRAAAKFSGRPGSLWGGGKSLDAAYLAERTELDQFAEQYSVNTQDEIIFWERCLEESETLQEAMEKYLSSSFVTATPQTPLSISETVQQIDTRLRSAFSSLRSAYQEIFTLDEATGETRFSLDGADITDKFSPILDAIKSLGELDGITVDYSAFDDFVSVLSDTSSTEADVQAQFDSLATSIIYASDCTNMSAETFNLLAESLSELGISNARETLKDILALQQSLAAAGIDAQTAMSGEADALQNLQIAGTETAEQLMAYYIQKQLAENPLTTLNDILQLENLCNALGVTGEMLQTITSLKLAFEAKESGAHAGGLDESIKAYQERLKELAAGYGTYGFEFGSAGTKSGFSSSGSRSRTTAETFDWTVQAIENIENEIKALDDIADSSYSTLAQKNEALAQQIGKVNDAVALGQQAYNTYMQKAEAVGLSGHYKDLAQSGSPGMEDITDETLKNQISEYQKWYEKAQETQTKIDSLYEKAKDIHVSSYENYVQELDTLRDNDTISEREYLDRMNALWEHYYADQTKYAVQAKEAKLKLLKDEKSYLESVANTAADLLGGQIDELKNRQEAEIEVLEAKKRPLEVQLELLEKQKEKEDRILSLQKAQYELKRAEQQRDKLTYVDGQMIYRADETNLRNARDAVDEAKYNIEKASIEDRIDAYDKEIDKIKERYDAEIAGMERLQNEWQNALALRERAQNFGDFESMFGEGSVAKLLDGDSSFISTWKQTYLNTLGGIDMVSSGTISEMTTRYAELAGLDLSNITEQTKTVASQFHAVNDAVNSLNNAIGTESPNTENNAPADKPSANAESASLSDALQNTYDIASEVLPEEAAMLNAITEAANTAAAAVNELKTAIASLNTLSLTPDSLAVSGSAYASGTRHAKKGLAIVGEEKPEMIITTDQKAYLAKQPTLLRMEGGETVLSGDETAKMLKARGFQPIRPDDFPLLKAFAAYSPEEIRQRFAPQMISPAGTTASATLQNAGHAVNNNSINNTPSYTTGDIHIHCPGITKDEVARQIGTELTNVFSGLSLKAYQRASITR